MKLKTSGIYAIYCLGNRKRYIGLSNDIESRWKVHKRLLRTNRHGNMRLQSSWNKYSSKVFKFTVLQEVPKLLLGLHEVVWIKHFDTMNPKYGFNMTSGGGHPEVSTETRVKLCIAHTGRKNGPHSPETKAKMSTTLTGRKYGPETRARMSAACKGRSISAETRAKISAARKGKGKGRTLSPETRARMSAASIGKPKSAEHRAKLSAARRPPHSVETRAKMSATRKGRKNGPLSAETRTKIGIGVKAACAQRQLDKKSENL